MDYQQQSHYNGMPRSRQQQHFEDMLITPNTNEHDEMQRSNSPATNSTLPRTTSAMSFNRRISNSSVASTRNNSSQNGFFGWGRKKSSYNDEDIDDEEGHGLNGRPEDVPDISMNELTVLRDRDRYPTVQSNQQSGRTMSISSTMSSGGFDTTPVIPTLRSSTSFAANQQNGQYRKNLTNSLKQAIRSGDGARYPGGYGPGPGQGPPAQGLSGQGPPGQGPPGQGPGQGPPQLMNGHFNGYPTQNQRSYPPPQQHHPQQYQQRPSSMQNRDSRLRSMMTGPAGPPPMDYGSPRTMSMNGYYGGPPNTGPGPGPGPRPGPGQTPGQNPGPPVSSSPGPHNLQYKPPQRISRPPSRLSQQHSPMVTTSTMTDPVDLSSLPTDPNSSSSNASTNSSDSIVDGTATTTTTASSVSATPVKSVATSSNPSDIELRAVNKALLDELRLVTSELADSIRRELGLVSSDDEPTESTNEFVEARERAQKLILLERELDLERRKRMIAQQKYEGGDDELNELLTSTQFKNTDLEKDLAEKDRLYTNEKRETEILKENISRLTNEYEELRLETNQLKNGILPELKSHVADLEVLTAAGNPIELLKQIEELKVENKKLQNLVEENSMRGPLGEKIKAVENQRDALREALRSLKERNDHEIRQSTERVRQLEGKLEKEKVISNQMQRKLVQTRSPSSYFATDIASSSSTTTATLNTSISNNSLTISPSTKHALSTSSSSGSLTSGNNNSNNIPETLSIPKRRGIGNVPGIIPPSVTFNDHSTSTSSRPSSPSPVNFEISQEPAWIDYINPSKLPVSQAHARQFSAASFSSQTSSSSTLSPSESTLFKPRRTEQLPLSLSATST